jgi:tetratricopeptide (TPR) repeat protein
MALEDRIRLPALNLIHRRPRLLDMLAHFVDNGHRLITVYAPGGYGKSILLADFAQTTDLPVCWCSLEPPDRDPTSFLTLFAYSITNRFHEIEPEPLLKLVERGDTQASIHRIVELLSNVGPHLIIIDDYHKAISTGMTLVLNRLLEQLPGISTMIVAARDDMNLATGQVLELLITERATGLSEEELRFNAEELQLVMRKRFGRQITPVQAEEIFRATDGNIAQILLAGHMMRAGQTFSSLRLLGEDRDIIYSYLAGEVLGKQPADLQRFMLYTSVLPDITPDICNALLDITSSSQCIERLMRNDLFITQIGDKFKYHDLFAEFLRNRLAEDPALYEVISLKAARLMAERAFFEEAVNLYLSVAAWGEAACILEKKGRFFYDTGRALTLHSWLSQISEEELARRPRLLLLYGMILNNDLGDLDRAITYYQRAEDKFLAQQDFIGAAEAQIYRASSLRMRGRAREALALTASGLEQLEYLKADSRLTAWAIRYRGLANSATGNVDKALEDLRRSLDLFKALEDTYYVGMCHHDIGVCLVKSGNANGARHHYLQALRIWETLGNANDLANTLNSVGVNAYLKGNYEEALKRFKESLDIAVQIGAIRRIAFAQAGIGDTYLELKDYVQSIEAYQISIEYAREAGVQSLEVYSLVKIGECFFQQHNLAEAFRLATQAREMAIEIGLFEQGLACVLQAKIYVRRAEYETSFDLFALASGCLSGSDIIEQAKMRFWWGYSLLLDLRASAALEQLQEGIRLTLTTGDLIAGLGPTLVETQRLFLHFLHRHDTPASVKDSIHFLLGQSPEKIDTTKPSLQVFAFGPPSLIVAGARKQFTQRGGIRKAPEFLLYLILAGQPGGCRWSDVCAAIWPDLEPQKASVLFHQYLKRFRKAILGLPDYLVLQDDYYQAASRYLDWCDALVFDVLFERAARVSPHRALELYLEIISLYQGEFLAGFELGEWGTAYRASYENRFFQAASLASQQLLAEDCIQQALAIIRKGLSLDYYREDLHRYALKAYAQANLYDQMVAHYMELSETFERELGGPPSVETARLYRQLLPEEMQLLADGPVAAPLTGRVRTGY